MKNMSSSLAKARGLGAAGNGTDHWIAQRISAIALIPLVIWFVIFVVSIVSSDEAGLLSIIKSPFNIIMMMFFIIAGNYHGFLGMEIIIGDYIRGPRKVVFIVLLKLLVIATIIAALSAVFVFHFAVFD